MKQRRELLLLASASLWLLSCGAGTSPGGAGSGDTVPGDAPETAADGDAITPSGDGDSEPGPDTAPVDGKTNADSVLACVPFCIAKACGDDGCGGSCGTCPEEAPACDLGYCVVPCDSDCSDKVCGDDGCGGYCGTCPPELPHCGITHQCELDPACAPGLCSVGGTVWAPEGTIPIAGALVRLVKEVPEVKGQGAICDACVLPAYYEPHAFSSYDGSFSFEVAEKGSWVLVVQKGGFRRVRTIEVIEGDLVLDSEMTTLPAVHAPDQGDEIPRMAVAGGGFDSIENTLAKLGLGSVDSWGSLIEGTEVFDLYDSWGWDDEDLDPEALFTDFGLMQQYQVIFFPCDSSWNDDLLGAPQVQENLRNYVDMGGRLYVTDWSYDILAEVFPGPILWANQTNTLGSAELSSPYDAPAHVDDPGLEAWLGAQGIVEFELEDNWTAIEETSTYVAKNEFGIELEMEPHVWVSSDMPSGVSPDATGLRPATVSFQHGCGRAMFSTYHTEGTAGQGLMAQERALLYIILEVAACIGHVNIETVEGGEAGSGEAQ